jgi:hypothetical protein
LVQTKKPFVAAKNPPVVSKEAAIATLPSLWVVNQPVILSPHRFALAILSMILDTRASMLTILFDIGHAKAPMLAIPFIILSRRAQTLAIQVALPCRKTSLVGNSKNRFNLLKGQGARQWRSTTLRKATPTRDFSPRGGLYGVEA